ncbi:MAG: transposase [Rhodocyclaceae bacterium]|nr:transposase [Rhodocyclaceae bacterium]
MSATASAVASCATPRAARYQRRRPEQTLWYRIVQTHFATWLDLASGEFGAAPPGYVERTFRRYLECGILAHGFARAYCDTCQHDLLIAYSCKGRGVCPSCNTRRMVETAAHFVDHVFPPVPVRQWVLAVPKRLRYFLQTDAALQGAVLRIFLSEVERALRQHSGGRAATARIGAVAFIHRFGSSLNAHVHFHCCVMDGVFEPSANADDLDTEDAPIATFHAAYQLDALAIQAVQTRTRKRILRTFVRRGLIDQADAKEMAQWEHGGGFSVDASVCIEGNDRAGLERLLRYCARPPFALEHLHQHDAEHVVYHNPKPHQGGSRELVLTPLELIDKIGAVIPPPRTHGHRYYGVLAPNAPMRAAVTALAPLAISPVGAGDTPSPATCGRCCSHASTKPSR